MTPNQPTTKNGNEKKKKSVNEEVVQPPWRFPMHSMHATASAHIFIATVYARISFNFFAYPFVTGFNTLRNENEIQQNKSWSSHVIINIIITESDKKRNSMLACARNDNRQRTILFSEEETSLFIFGSNFIVHYCHSNIPPKLLTCQILCLNPPEYLEISSSKYL